MKPRIDPATWFSLLASILAVAAGLLISTDYVHDTYCGIVYPLKSKTPRREKLRDCSTLVQKIDWDRSFNIAHRMSDEVPGWDVFSPADPALPARLTVEVVPDRGEAVWFPRLSGTDSSIELLSDDDTVMRLLDRVSGGAKWSSIGSQHVVDLYALRYGYLKNKDVPSRLVFQLRGRWTQIWSRQGAFLF